MNQSIKIFLIYLVACKASLSASENFAPKTVETDDVDFSLATAGKSTEKDLSNKVGALSPVDVYDDKQAVIGKCEDSIGGVKKPLSFPKSTYDAMSNPRQLNLSVSDSSPKEPVDLMSRLRHRISEGRNSFADNLNKHIGISLPTKLLDKSDEHKESSKKGGLSLRGKVTDMTARLNIFSMAFKIINKLTELVQGATGGKRNFVTDLLTQVLSLLNIF